MRVHLSALGCKLNQAELEALARRFRAAGHEVVARLEEAEVHVVNSCSVTAWAASESRRMVRRSRRRNPGLRTVLTGCSVSGASAEAGALAEADLIVDNRGKAELVAAVEAAFRPAGTITEPSAGPYAPFPGSHLRPAVKIGDGCDARCAFCIIPTTRGRERSRPLREIVEEVGGLAESGHREVILTGVQISDWKDGGARLADLVDRLLGETAIERLRLTSLAPWDFDRRLLRTLADPRVCRHVHLSLQSGSSAVLRRMRRPSTAERYRRLVEELVAAVPGLAVTTDVIVGFPGESDEEHQESCQFVAGLPFARIHVFPFSPRPGTAAETLPGRLHGAVIRARSAEMLELAACAERRFAGAQLGSVVSVLWESRDVRRVNRVGAEGEGAWLGYSDNYLRVRASASALARNALTTTRLVALAGEETEGLVVEGLPVESVAMREGRELWVEGSR